MKTTETVQLAPPPSVAGLKGQLLAWIWKSPLAVTAVMVSGVAKTFFNVTLLGALVAPTPKLPKDKVDGVMVTGAVPVPVSEDVWGLLAALSVTVRVPVRVPVVVG